MSTRRAARSRAYVRFAAAAATAGSLFAYERAFAQSTGSLTVQEVVVTARHTEALGGIVTLQEAPKTREIITQAYISAQPSGANALSDLNLVPGVNFTNDDPYGMSGGGGHFSIRGIKGANVAELVDGVPLNDAGNYAIYPGELVDPEVISNVNIITGSTDVDAPTSSALGGLVNINTLTPSERPSGLLSGSGGSFAYWRVAALLNTGAVGPLGTRAWVEASDQRNNKFTGVGQDRKWQVNAKIYQPLWRPGDFIAVAGFYDRQVADFYDGVNFASYGVTSGSNYHPVTTAGYNYHGLLATPWNTDYSPTYVLPSSTASNAAFQGVEENPTYTGNLRGESRFTLLRNLQLTVDPSYQWVLANGEGTQTVKGTDPRLVGSGLTASRSNLPACYSAAGVVTGLDLDGATGTGGAPVCTDTVRLLSPSNTQTNRFTMNASVVWTVLPGHVVRFAYAYDHANVRQTGEYGQLQPDGYPYSVFGGLQGYGTPVIAADGSTLEKRNRRTTAVLNQYSVEYIGKFFNDAIRLDLGVRDPYYGRDLHQYCYTNPPTAVYCTNFATVAAAAGYPVAPFHISTSYNKLLPNVGVTWRISGPHSVFADYTQALNAPVNDDLYAIAVIGHGSTANAVGKDTVQPETSETIEAGYRYQTDAIRATLDVYELMDNNHIVQSFNQLTNDSIDQNVGSIRYVGVEGLAAVTPVRGLTLYGAFAYNHSDVRSNIPYSATITIPTAGRSAVDSPELTLAARATYAWRDFVFGLQTKYVSKRYVTLVNDLAVPAYATVDADVRWRIPSVPGATLQVNVINLLDTRYIGSINTTSSNNASLPYYSYAYAYQGAPRTVQATLKIAF